jgi:hypothetical protein
MVLSFLNPLMFLIVIVFFLPKGIETYFLWKKNNKPMTLSLSIGLFMISFSILSANYLSFIRIVLNGLEKW